MRTFKGHPFEARCPLQSVKEDILMRGRYQVTFGNGDVRCAIARDRQIEFMASKNKGDLLKVEGTVQDHVFGAVVLDSCVVSD